MKKKENGQFLISFTNRKWSICQSYKTSSAEIQTKKKTKNKLYLEILTGQHKAKNKTLFALTILFEEREKTMKQLRLQSFLPAPIVISIEPN